MARQTIDNAQDVLDSRDIIARLAELTEEVDTQIGDFTERFQLDEGTARGIVLDKAEEAGEDVCDLREMVEELDSLEKFAEEASSCADDWEHGVSLIRRSYFETYCRELVSDIGDMPRELALATSRITSIGTGFLATWK